MVSNGHGRTTRADHRRAADGKRRPLTAGQGPFAWLGRAVVRHPWRVIALWIVAAVAVIATSPGLPTTTNESSFLPKSYESIRAADLQSRAFPQAGHVTSAAAIIVFARADGAEADRRRLGQGRADRGVAATPGTSPTSTGSPPARRRRTAWCRRRWSRCPTRSLNGSGTAAGDAVKTLRADIKPLMTGTGLTEGVTGSAAQILDSQQSSNRADQIVLLATLALILILLLVIFRSPIIALLPLILIALVSQVATGLVSDVNKAFNLNTDSSISTILIVVLFGIGTDYILFLIFRYRERLRAGEDAKQAMVTAVTRVGEAIASAAGVVIVAFLALTLSTLSVLRAIGPALAIAVATTLVAGLTLVPAVVSLLGTAGVLAVQGVAEGAGGGQVRRDRPVARPPSGAGSPPCPAWCSPGWRSARSAINPTFDLSSAGIPASAESQTALKTLEKGLPPGATDPTDVFLQSTSGQPLTTAQLAAYGAKLKTLDGVGAVAPPKLSADKATADYTVTLTHDPMSTAAVERDEGPAADGRPRRGARRAPTPWSAARPRSSPTSSGRSTTTTRSCSRSPPSSSC